MLELRSHFLRWTFGYVRCCGQKKECGSLTESLEYHLSQGDRVLLKLVAEPR